MFLFSNRERGEFLLETIDLDAQLLAIRGLIARNRQADEATSQAIRGLEADASSASGEHGMHLSNIWQDECHGSVYQGAANSMAAAGMLAPLLESLLTELFSTFGSEFGAMAPTTMGVVRPTASATKAWDPHVFFDPVPKKNFTKGFEQLAQASGMAAYLPSNAPQLLAALFGYRNRMFHLGFEWPKDERAKFELMVTQEGWPVTWFDRATSAGEPWVIYMTDTLIDACLDLINKLVEGAGEYVSKLLAQQAPVRP